MGLLRLGHLQDGRLLSTVIQRKIKSSKMAARPTGFGLTRELENKKRNTYDSELARKVCDWFNAVCKQSADSQYIADFGGNYDWNSTHSKLKDGKLVIAVANRIVPKK